MASWEVVSRLKCDYLSGRERATTMMEASREVGRKRLCPACYCRTTDALLRYQRRCCVGLRPSKIIEGVWLWRSVRDGSRYRVCSFERISTRLVLKLSDCLERQARAERIYRSAYACPLGLRTVETGCALGQVKPTLGRRRIRGVPASGFVSQHLRTTVAQRRTLKGGFPAAEMDNCSRKPLVFGRVSDVLPRSKENGRLRGSERT